MNKQTNVLVFPCGAESALEIHIALKDVMNIKLIGASGREDHGRMVYENYYGGFPKIDESNFIAELNKLIEKESIDLILPTHDTVLVFLEKHKDQINTKLAIAGLEQAVICRSKKKIYELFENDYFCPILYNDIHEIQSFPVYAKLDEGQGSKGAFIVENKEQLLDIKDLENYVVTEYLPGDELTVDCFTDRHGALQFVGPRIRKRVFDGVCVNSISVEVTKEIKEIAQIVSDKIKIRGSWYFQLKKNDNGDYRLLEASIKIAGNMNLFRGLGVNFPLLMVYDYLNYDVKVLSNNYSIEVDRSLRSRYIVDLNYDTIYIDFDDTITKNEKVNPDLMYFMYQQKNIGKRIVLITKHKYNLDETLNKLAIHKGIFDEIIHLNMDDLKSKYITNTSTAIFIDNAFGERLEVKKAHGIPVFDVDAVGTLIDYKA